jgi:hypothetical protein
MQTKKVISKTNLMNMSKSSLLLVRQTCFAYNFFGTFFGHISTFSNFEAKRAKTAQKIKKT